MKFHLRDLVGLLVAPMAAPLVFGTLQLCTAGSKEPRLQAFGESVAVSGFVGYPVAWIVGIPTFLLLRRLRCESLVNYTIAGAFFGFLYLPAMSGFHSLNAGAFLVSGVFALLGGTVGVCFGLITGHRGRAAKPSADATTPR